MRTLPDWFPLVLIGVLLLVAAGVAPPCRNVDGDGAMTPFDYLGALLDRIHTWNPVAGYLAALVIAAACAVVIESLNQDGASYGK